MNLIKPLTHAFVWCLAAGCSAQSTNLEFVPNGARERLGYVDLKSIRFSPTRPPTVTKTPEGADDALYVSLRLGTDENPKVVVFALLSPESDEPRLVVDADGDGDLTNDPAVNWIDDPKALNLQRKSNRRRQAEVDLPLPLGNTPCTGRILITLPQPTPEASPDAGRYLQLTADYYYTGTAQIGRNIYPVLLVDTGVTGDFRGVGGRVWLFVDTDKNNKFNRGTERFDVRNPVTVSGENFDILNLPASGERFDVAPSRKQPPEKKTSEKGALVQGQLAPSFEAVDMEGNKVRFPEDYKGKLVLLDFWATWCPPCRGEIPGIVAAYKAHHDEGFEVLGVSLDRADAKQTLQDFVKSNNMPWRQIYDGKYWDAEVAKLYGVRSIPCPILVDGSTGKILEIRTPLRGVALEDSILKALKKFNRGPVKGKAVDKALPKDDK